MANQCVHCGALYEDGSEQMLKGCSTCNSKFFFYITKEKLDKIKSRDGGAKVEVSLTPEEKTQLEEEVREMMGVPEEEETPIVLDFESIRILKPGKYLLDLNNLFTKNKPLVYTLEDGKYFIDLSRSMPGKTKG